MNPFTVETDPEMALAPATGSSKKTVAPRRGRGNPARVQLPSSLRDGLLFARVPGACATGAGAAQDLSSASTSACAQPGARAHGVPLGGGARQPERAHARPGRCAWPRCRQKDSGTQTPPAGGHAGPAARRASNPGQCPGSPRCREPAPRVLLSRSLAGLHLG